LEKLLQEKNIFILKILRNLYVALCHVDWGEVLEERDPNRLLYIFCGVSNEQLDRLSPYEKKHRKNFLPTKHWLTTEIS